MISNAVTADAATASTAGRSRYLRRVGAAFALGLPGVLALAVYSALNPPAGVALGPTALFAAALVPSGLILLVSVAVGASAAPKVGLRSHLLGRVAGDPAPERRFSNELPLAAGLGIAAGVATLAVAEVLAPYVPTVFSESGGATVGTVLAFAPVRFLYGGVTEELLVRFGLLALVAFVGFRLVNRGRESPSAAVMWGAVALSVLAFGLGHLPATAAVAELTPAVVVRALAGNGIGGLVFGWLYWRRSLEAAMVAHVALHVVLVAVSLAIVP